MIELNRHIEILLLNSDCVIVPNLGGFMTHHVDARFDEQDNMFVPPVRTLGFNPQLTMNDSLLAQSYVEAYDISYPEAMRRIEAEVSELKQTLIAEGSYTMNGIGELTINEDGKIVFEPCEAGLLTPALYGLGAFEMKRLNDITPIKEEEETVSKSEQQQESAIVIKMSWLRNAIAIAAAAILFFFILTPPINSDPTANEGVTMSQVELLPMPKAEPVKKAELKPLDTKKAETPEEVTPKVETAEVETPKAETPEVQEPKAEEPKAETPAKPETTFCLVLASQVAKQGADRLVNTMQQKGYASTRVHINNNVRRVVYGNYPTMASAYNALNKLRATGNDFDEAWVYKIKGS